MQIFGEGWSSSINGVIRFNNPTADFSTSLPTRAYISLGDGRYRSFVRRADGTWIPKGMHNDKLVLGAPNDQVGYLHFIFQTIDTDTQYIFKVVSTPSINPDFPEPNHMAVLSLIRKPKNQWVRIDHEFNSGSNQFNPVRAIDHAGYSLLLSYNGAGQVHSATLNNPASNQISNASYTYDNEKRLASVTYHDGNTRYFIYTNTQNPKLLTGWGWNGVQQEFYAYDDQGLAVGSSLINGIDSTQIDYSAATQSESTYIYYKNVGVIDALGTRRSYNYTSAGHRLNVSVANLHGFYENQPGADTNPPNLSQYNP